MDATSTPSSAPQNPPPSPIPVMTPSPIPSPIVVPTPAVFGNNPAQVPTRQQQSWGALISILIIVAMIIIGAFYAWGKRIAQEHAYQEAASSTGA